jgi:2-(1,2-epoxy-1,2-dihydrophenyl)acetyl-CoA isomerase
VSEVVLVERRDPVALVRLNSPTKRNVLSTALYTALGNALEEIFAEPAVRALVITGGAQFCAGGDLEGLDAPVLEMRRAMQTGHRIVRAITSASIPVLAAVEGTAYGAGFSIAMACDFVLADANTRFCAPFGRLGLAPDYGLLWTLPQRIGIGRTREIVMLCEPLSGTDAHTWGAVDRLCVPGTVLESALALATRLVSSAPATLATTKAVLSRQPQSLDALLAWEADTQALLLQSQDFREGVSAFLEKRAPRFMGC